jgi:hypothetical protein
MHHDRGRGVTARSTPCVASLDRQLHGDRRPLRAGGAAATKRRGRDRVLTWSRLPRRAVAVDVALVREGLATLDAVRGVGIVSGEPSSVALSVGGLGASELGASPETSVNSCASWEEATFRTHPEHGRAITSPAQQPAATRHIGSSVSRSRECDKRTALAALTSARNAIGFSADRRRCRVARLQPWRDGSPTATLASGCSAARCSTRAG